MAKDQEQRNALNPFLIHLAIFVVVNLVILVIPVFYDGKVDLSFEDRGPMLYGSIGWGIGVLIHGAVVLYSRFTAK